MGTNCELPYSRLELRNPVINSSHLLIVCLYWGCTVSYSLYLVDLSMCDEEALRAVQHARFSPDQVNGVPVNVITSITFIFTLS